MTSLSRHMTIAPTSSPIDRTPPRPSSSVPKRPSHFFALRPASGAIGEMREARDRPGFGGLPVRDEHLHFTLLWLGYDHPGTPALVASAREAAGTIEGSPLRIVFDKLVAADNSLLLLPGDPLDHLHAFQRRLALALAAWGVRAERAWRFNPHVKLRRGPCAGRADAVDPIAWTAAEFVLIHSLPDPFRHETAGVWPLNR